MKVAGGQALVEGIALRSERWRVAVVRRASGELVVGTGPARASGLRRIPFLRGVVAWLVDAPVENEWAGMKVEEDADRLGTADEPLPGLYRGRAPVVRHEELPPPRTRRPAAVLLVIVLSQAIPQAILYVALRALGVELAAAPSGAPFQTCLFATMFAIMALYFLAVRRLPDMRRVFQYAAAFKQVLWAASSDEEPSPAALRSHPPWHPHGTAFAAGLVVLVPALVVPVVARFDLLPSAHDPLAAHAAACGLRILLLPIAIALVDELGRLLATARLRPAVAVLFAPFAFLDRLLTAPPEEEHLELARTALLELEKLETR